MVAHSQERARLAGVASDSVDMVDEIGASAEISFEGIRKTPSAHGRKGAERKGGLVALGALEEVDRTAGGDGHRLAGRMWLSSLDSA